jgi:predicted kinase
MNKIVLNRPVLAILYGFPGSGKSYVARQLAETVQMAHISADRLRSELFEHPRYDQQEDAIIAHLMNYITEEFLKAGVSVVYDANAMRLTQRRTLRELARQQRAECLLIWLQVDTETAYLRTQGRDRRTSDDKFAEPQTRLTFDKQLSFMQNPQNEDYLVISGKHNFVTQKAAILSRLYQQGFIDSSTVQSNVAAPGLVNLVPNPQAGRVDMSRRNINIG